MLQSDRIKLIIKERWGETRLAQLCARIIDYVVSSDEDALEVITFYDISSKAEMNVDDEEIMKAVAILSSRFSILKLHFVYFDKEKRPYYLNDEDSYHFLNDGYVIDPNTGEKILDTDGNVKPYLKADRSILTQVFK